MLAGLDRLRQQVGAHLRGGGIEEHGIGRVGQCGRQVGGPALDAMLPGDRRHLVGIAPDQDRVGHDAVAVGERHAALLAYGDDRADQVLIEPHAPGDAVHDDAETARGHDRSLPQ